MHLASLALSFAVAAGPAALGRNMTQFSDEQLAASDWQALATFSRETEHLDGRLETFRTFKFRVAPGRCYAAAVHLDRTDYAVDRCTANGPKVVLKESAKGRALPKDFYGFSRLVSTACPVSGAGEAELTLKFGCQGKTAHGALHIDLYSRKASAAEARAKTFWADQAKGRAGMASCDECRDKLKSCRDSGGTGAGCDRNFRACLKEGSVPAGNCTTAAPLF